MSEPHCPKCSVPMRLMRVLPILLPPETGVRPGSSPVGNAGPRSTAPCARAWIPCLTKGKRNRGASGKLWLESDCFPHAVALARLECSLGDGRRRPQGTAAFELAPNRSRDFWR
jgi:hypothetical protein